MLELTILEKDKMELDKNFTYRKGNYLKGFFSLTYGNGKFVGVSRFDGKIGISENGKDFKIVKEFAGYYWHTVNFCNNKFVVVGDKADGEVYTQTRKGKKIKCYDNIISAIAYSEDGINWFEGTIPNGDRWSICYYNNKLMLMDNKGKTIYFDF